MNNRGNYVYNFLISEGLERSGMIRNEKAYSREPLSTLHNIEQQPVYEI